jgi:CRISPR-associated endonuclease/helicase Cas3
VTDPITARFDAEIQLTGAWLPASQSTDYFPGIRRPDTHQVETREALLDPGTDAILNTNPTGAGKTLSWAAPTIRSGETGNGWIVVATYPTNALVADQLVMLRSLIDQYYSNLPAGLEDQLTLTTTADGSKIIQTAEKTFSLTQRVQRVTGEDTLGKSTSDEIKRVYQEALEASNAGLPTIILTTPDILTLIAKSRIRDPDARGLVPGVDAIVIDEFHLANPRAKRHLPFLLDFYQNRLGNRTPLDKLVFLSATPDEQYISQIQRGLDTTTVTRQSFAEQPQQPTRQILPEATLYSKTTPIFTNGRWISNHSNEVIEWVESGDEQALIIVDSVREVDAVATALAEQTTQSVGKVYGWKQEGRQAVVESSDIVVGNTAVEVGIDFEAVDRILTTGYTPNSALQRLGRMRTRENISECEIALITTSAGHNALIRQSQDGELSRQKLEKALHKIGQASETPYYGLLCGMYFEYLWTDARIPLRNRLRKQDLGKYQQAVHDHFSHDANEFNAKTDSPKAFWKELHKLRTTVYGDGEHPIFEEMHRYRSSSLSVAIIDETDPEQPLKEYALDYILRYGQGEFIPQTDTISTLQDSTDQEITSDKQQKIQAIVDRTVGTFHLRGLNENPAGIGIEDYTQVTEWEGLYRETGNESRCLPDLMPDPKMKRIEGGIKGSEHIDLGNKILAQYARGDKSTVRSRFELGPYANIYPVNDSSVLLLWQDAVLAHANLMSDYYANM